MVSSRPASERPDRWRHVAITGASSGIGAALARALARPGLSLSLGGRDRARLAQVTAECQAAGADTCGTAVDVCQQETLRGWLDSRAYAGPIDLVVACAGVTDEHGHPPQETAAINFVGIINTLEAALPHMARGGQLALIGSLASWRAQPSAPAYAASKAAVRLYAEAIRDSLAKDGLSLSLVLPGFVATPMLSGRRGPTPHLLSAERAANIMIAGLARRRATIVFPKTMYAKTRLIAVLIPALAAAGSRLSFIRRQSADGPATPRSRPE
ncbi:MAG: SDR family NAD(P)-dependent oxidoreductase [Geminicoccaceae bacterium]